MVQAIWLLFILFALSLAVPGVAPYNRFLQEACAGSGCLAGQLTPQEAQATLIASGSLTRYAYGMYLVHIFTCALMLLTAAALIIRKPKQPAAIFGAFMLTAAGTHTLAQALATSMPDRWLPAQFLQFILLSTLTIFLCLLPDGRFHPAWLRWAVLALIPVVAVGVFVSPGSTVAKAVSAAIATVVITNTWTSYRKIGELPTKERFTWSLVAIFLLTGAQVMGRPIRILPLPPVLFTPLSVSFSPLFGMLLVVAALACLAVALFSDDLFQLDLIINRAIVYGFLTLFIVGGYILIVGYLSLIFQSSGSLWFSLVATGVVAILFQPLRQLISALCQPNDLWRA